MILNQLNINMNVKSLLNQNQIILQDLQNKSTRWYFNQADKLQATRVTPNKVLNDPATKTVSRIRPGELYCYFYDPKWKEELPYYDKFPMVFPFAAVKNGFIGLNMHYLPYPARMELFQALYDNSQNKFITENEKLKISWQIIQGISKFPLAKPCVKMYLYNHIRSPITKINSTDWVTALLLPVQRFQKKSAVAVWMDSMGK